MFSFVCAHCGHLEITHSYDLEYFLETGRWANDEYQEDPNLVELTISEIVHRKGYKYSISECLGFQYRKKDREDVIKIFAFAREGLFIEYMPEEWQASAEKLCKEAKENQSGREGFLYLPASIHIIYNPNTGSCVSYQTE